MNRGMLLWGLTLFWWLLMNLSISIYYCKYGRITNDDLKQILFFSTVFTLPFFLIVGGLLL